VNGFIANAFGGDESGCKPIDPKINLGSSNASIGIAPFAAPLCPNNQTCDGVPPNPPPPHGVFGFCASLPNNSNGPKPTVLPAVAEFLAITNAGETLVSASVGSSPDIICP